MNGVVPPKLTPNAAPIDRERLAIPHANPFVCDIQIDRAQVSRAVPHVSNIEFVRWLDRAAELHADSLGYTRQSMLERNMMWFVARHEIDYMAEAWPHDELLIATWVRDIHKVKSWRDYVIARRGDDRIICRAATLWVLVDLEKRKPIRVPAEMVARFDPVGAGQPSLKGPPTRS